MSRVDLGALILCSIGLALYFASLVVRYWPEGEYLQRWPDGWLLGGHEIFVYSGSGLVYGRLLGWGLWLGSYAQHEPLFSERNGFDWILWRTKNWRLKLLVRDR